MGYHFNTRLHTSIFTNDGIDHIFDLIPILFFMRGKMIVKPKIVQVLRNQKTTYLRTWLHTLLIGLWNPLNLAITRRNVCSLQERDSHASQFSWTLSKLFVPWLSCTCLIIGEKSRKLDSCELCLSIAKNSIAPSNSPHVCGPSTKIPPNTCQWSNYLL